MRKSALAAVGFLLLAGCATPDRAVFVTKTSIGIDADTTPPIATIAYDRVEGFLGPSYSNGEAPPVAAIIQTGGNVFNPQIRQLYATGNAALIATQPGAAVPDPTIAMSGTPRLMFFGTSTTLGLKVAFAPEGPPTSFTFGFKRKEASFIPLQPHTTQSGTTFKYPSVFAAIDSTTETKNLVGTGLSLSQFFASGGAAEFLAWDQREKFKERAADLIAAARKTRDTQRATSLFILRAYAALDPATEQAKIQQVWDDAARLKLFKDPTTLARLKSPPPGITSAGIYADEIGGYDLDDPARATLLQIHLKLVQSLAKKS